MGIFDFLFGKAKKTQVSDRIWLTAEAKWGGLCREAAGHAQAGQRVCIAAHFRDCFQEVQRRLDDSGMTVETFDEGRRFDARGEDLRRATEGADVVLCFADAFAGLHTELIAGEEFPLEEILVAERHPLPQADQNLIDAVNGSGGAPRIVFHLSLDDVVLRAFCGDSVAGILRKLGMKENEAIESEMVTRRIREAQRKIDMARFGSERADSAEDWFRLNCPELLDGK